jgi:hypothetical protein
MEVWMIFSLGFGCGGAFIWFAKTRIQLLVIDGNTLSAKLHAKADAIISAGKNP